MKKGVVGVFFLILIGLTAIFAATRSISITSHQILVKQTPSPSPTTAIQTPSESIFVPYWGLSNSLSDSSYAKYMYFAVIPKLDGIDTTDTGYKNITSFLQNVPNNSSTFLTLSMVDPTINEKALSDPTIGQKIIQDTVALAKKDKFRGVILDLEYNALAFDEVVHSVTNFSKEFALSAHTQGLLFYQTIPGDTFYRGKPYDVSQIGSFADGIFIMSYDLHKANGDPGPNFPLDSSVDEYSLKTMASDFLKKIVFSKITVVFGAFGYDWTLGDNDESRGVAQSLSLKDVQQKFLDSCALLNCISKRDAKSSEMNVSYTDSTGDNHIVWFDDMDSIEAKKAYLKTQGITSTALWAYSYF